MLTPADRQYNVFGKIRSEIDDFDQKGVYIVGKPTAKDEFDDSNKGRYGGFYYSQRQTLEALDMAMASKYKRGNIDSEGKRKFFLNKVNFYKEVAMNQINVDVENYILQPANDDELWPTTLMDNKFKLWAVEQSYDDEIDDQLEDYCGKGAAVSKKTKNGPERVPLRSLRNTQTAKSLFHAATSGGYVIIESEMYRTEMLKYAKWHTDGVEAEKPYTVYEKYGMMPKGKILEWQGNTATDKDWTTYVLSIQIVSPDVETFKGPAGLEDGQLLYLQELKPEKFPLEEVHYSRPYDGRWLGVGEVEKQLENQIAANFTANLRHRGLLWAVKKLFKTNKDDIATNLLMEVKDGTVLELGKNGQLEQVNTQSQHLGDFAADEQAWDENSQQISFAFEAATGESMPSGTPFRLGAILTAAVSKYFMRKQTRFSTFLTRSFFNQIIPIFKEANSEEHTVQYGVSHDDYDMMKQGMATSYANDLVHQEWMKGNQITFDQAMAHVMPELERHPYLYCTVPKDYYADARPHMILNINKPIQADVESLTTLYQSLVGAGDTRAQNVLNKIFSLKGQNIQQILGPAPKQQPSSVPQGGGQPVASNVMGNQQPQPQAQPQQ